MNDANSNAETEGFLRVKPGSSRSSTIAAFYRAVDDYYAGRSALHVQGESDKVDEDPDVRTDLGVGSSPDVGEADSQLGGGTSDNGGSSSPTELGRETPDEGVTGDSVDTPVEAGGTDVEQASVERDEQETDASQGEQRPPRFHFAPIFHSRGDRIN